MFHYIKGYVTMKFEGGIVIENNDIGYEVFVADNSRAYLADSKEKIMIYTVMIVREDDVSIYGFSEKEEVDLFKKLITVSGVGAKAAMAILSAMPASETKKAIAFEDAATLTKANGIGKKIAQRIVLELKDKIGEVGSLEKTTETLIGSDVKTEAISALVSLGYSKSEAMSALLGINDENLTTEEYIKKALKGMGK